MANLWQDLRGLAANRTGVPSVDRAEDFETIESKRGAWLAILAVAAAFAILLQMESERVQSTTKEPRILVGADKSPIPVTDGEETSTRRVILSPPQEPE
jgi:hypothetical protein